MVGTWEVTSSHVHATPTLLSCFDVYGSQIASADSGKVLNSNPARRFGLTATLWRFHMVAVSLTDMYAVHVRRSCTQVRLPPYETAIGWRPHRPVLVFVGPDMLP